MNEDGFNFNFEVVLPGSFQVSQPVSRQDEDTFDTKKLIDEDMEGIGLNIVYSEEGDLYLYLSVHHVEDSASGQKYHGELKVSLDTTSVDKLRKIFNFIYDTRGKDG